MSRETMALYKKHGTTPVLELSAAARADADLLRAVQRAERRQGQARETQGRRCRSPEPRARRWSSTTRSSSAWRPSHETLIDAVNSEQRRRRSSPILVTLVVLMIASQFFTQLQIISKNLSPEAKTGQAYQMQQHHALHPAAGASSSRASSSRSASSSTGSSSNLWTMGQQFLVIREMPTPWSEAAKAARGAPLHASGKALDSSGKVIPMDKYRRRAAAPATKRPRRPSAAAPKRQQPVSKQRAKKQSQKQRRTAADAARRRRRGILILLICSLEDTMTSTPDYAPVDTARADREPATVEQLEEEGDVAADFLEGLLDIADIDGDLALDVRARPRLRVGGGAGGRLRRLSSPTPDTVQALQELTRIAVQSRDRPRSRA